MLLKQFGVCHPTCCPCERRKSSRFGTREPHNSSIGRSCDRLFAMGDVTTTPDLAPPVAFLPARVILGLFVALVALGLLFANSRPDPRNAPPPKATTSRAIPHKASQGP